MKLFTPKSISSLTLRNRIVFPPFEHNTATEDGFVTQGTLDFYKRAASGGAGLVITGATNVNPDRRLCLTKYICDLSHDRYIAGHHALAEVIHKEGAKCFVQLVDKSLAAKARMPADLPENEIWRIIEYFADGARRVKEAGFDGVDLHFATAYTVFQFLSRIGNERTDQWGGSIEKNARIAVEIVRRVREAVGSDFPISPRFCADELREGGNTIEHTTLIAKMLVEAGADALNVSAGTFRLTRGDADGFILVPDRNDTGAPFGMWSHLAAAIKTTIESAVPVIAVGKIGSPELAEELLMQGKADLIAMARALLIDPSLPRKAEEGRNKEIIQCTYCGFCAREYGQGRTPYCTVLAKMEKEGSAEARRLSLEPILQAKREAVRNIQSWRR